MHPGGSLSPSHTSTGVTALARIQGGHCPPRTHPGGSLSLPLAYIQGALSPSHRVTVPLAQGHCPPHMHLGGSLSPSHTSRGSLSLSHTSRVVTVPLARIQGGHCPPHTHPGGSLSPSHTSRGVTVSLARILGGHCLPRTHPGWSLSPSHASRGSLSPSHESRGSLSLSHTSRGVTVPLARIQGGHCPPRTHPDTVGDHCPPLTNLVSPSQGQRSSSHTSRGSYCRLHTLGERGHIAPCTLIHMAWLLNPHLCSATFRDGMHCNLCIMHLLHSLRMRALIELH
jgi:hypothetical protein